MATGLRSYGLLFDNQASTPATPIAGRTTVYADVNKVLSWLTDAGTAYQAAALQRAQTFTANQTINNANLVLAGTGVIVGAEQASAPGSPAAGYQVRYPTTTGWKSKTSAGTVYTAADLERAQTWTAAQVINADLTIGNGSVLYLDAAAGLVRDLRFSTSGVNRWLFRCNADTESGSDAGSNWQLISRTDAGGTKTIVLHVDRATGNLGINTNVPTNQLDINSGAFRLRNSSTPVNGVTSGNQGEIRWDSTHIWVATVTGTTWKSCTIA